MKPGFLHEDKKIMFMEAKGKDISFNRWRVTLYYQPNFALTHFLNSQQEYDDFITSHKADCYEDYNEWRQEVNHVPA